MDGEGSGASSSLEEARLRNIARNNDFLRSLFGPSEVVVQNEVEKLESGATQASSEKSITFEKLRIETTRSLAQQFSLRDAEIRELVSFVTSDLQNSPALLVCGSSGSGKSALCSSVLHKLDVPHCILSGSGFAGARPCIVAMWDAIRDKLRSYRMKLQDKYSVLIPLGPMGRKAMKFADLVLSFGALVDKVLGSPQLGQQLEPQEECFYVVLDGFHHIAAQDPVLATSLLNLSQHCHRQVKVIALCESVPVQAHLHHLVLRLPAYSELQLSSIVQGKLGAGLEEYAARKYEEGPDDREREVVLSAAQRWGLLKASTSRSGGMGKRDHQAVDAAVETVAEFLYHALWPRVAEAAKASFRTMLNVALPILMCTSTHPTVLLDASTACFTAMYGSAPEELVRSAALHYLQIAAAAPSGTSGTGGMSGTAVGSPLAGRKSPRRSANSSPRSPLPSSVSAVKGECPEVDDRLLGALVAHYVPAATVGGVRAAVRLVHHLPSYSSAAAEVACLGKRKAVCLERPVLVLPDTEREAGQTAGPAGTNRPLLASCELERVDPASMRVAGWCLLCPIRVRYLVVAAFLAGHNPKETDNLKFVGEQAGKRRKQRAGCDKDVDLAAAGNKAAAAKGGGALLIPRYFSLERLLSIYAQIVGIVEGRKPVGYGTVSIYATVKTLVEKGLLSESSTWSLERPMYLSCVSFDTAQRLAQLMRFELQDFMYTKTSGYHSSSTL